MGGPRAFVELNNRCAARGSRYCFVNMRVSIVAPSDWYVTQIINCHCCSAVLHLKVNAGVLQLYVQTKLAVCSRSSGFLLCCYRKVEGMKTLCKTAEKKVGPLFVSVALVVGLSGSLLPIVVHMNQLKTVNKCQLQRIWLSVALLTTSLTKE